MKKAPNQIDIHVGARVRLARSLIGLSQEKLGFHLGITFQQVQKYEKGTNRVSASRLLEMARIFGKPVGWFFEGLQDGDDKQDNLLEQAVQSNAGMRLLRIFVSASEIEQKMIANLAGTVVSNATPAE